MLVNRRYRNRIRFVDGVEIVDYSRAESLVRKFLGVSVRKARQTLRDIKSGACRPLSMYGLAALTVDSFGAWVIVDNFWD